MSLKSTRKEIVARQLMKIANSLVEAGDEENFDEEYKTPRNFNPDSCPEFSKKQNLGKGIVVYDVENTWEGMMAVRAAMDTSWGYDEGKWEFAKRDHGKMDRAWLH